MSSLSLPTPLINATAAPAATSAAELARRGQIHDTAQKFEASFLTSVLQTMFQSVSTAPPFGGGPGEDMWKSFLAEAMAKDMAGRGGVGVAASVEREMLKLQGLKDAAQGGAGKPGGAPKDTAKADTAAAGAAQGSAVRKAPAPTYALQMAAAPKPVAWKGVVQ